MSLRCPGRSSGGWAGEGDLGVMGMMRVTQITGPAHGSVQDEMGALSCVDWGD